MKQIKANDLREVLKNMMSKELDDFPELLNKLEPNDRIGVIIKLMPYVFPKVDGVKLDKGEPIQFEFNN